MPKWTDEDTKAAYADRGKCMICPKSGIHTHSYAEAKDHWRSEFFTTEPRVPLYLNGRKVGEIPESMAHDRQEINRRLEEIRLEEISQASSDMLCPVPRWRCLQEHNHEVPVLSEPKSTAMYRQQMLHDEYAERQQQWYDKQMMYRQALTRYECPDCEAVLRADQNTINNHKLVCIKLPPMSKCEICSWDFRTREMQSYIPRVGGPSVTVCPQCHKDLTLPGPTDIYILRPFEWVYWIVGILAAIFIWWIR